MNHLTADDASAQNGHPGTKDAGPLDLQQFCGDPKSETRSWVLSPFRIGEFVYATDGVMLVRVDKGVAAAEELPDTVKYKAKLIARIEGYFARVNNFGFSSCVATLPPRARPVECFDCRGRGHKHDCPDCTCECDGCDGDGLNDPEARTTVDFAGTILALSYVRKMLALPRVEVAIGSANSETAQPFFFRFAGGEGALMPCTKPRVIHLDIDLKLP